MPDDTLHFGDKIVSDGNTVYYVNTLTNFILKMECQSDLLASCGWTRMEQKLSDTRFCSLAFLVDDELTECSEA